MIDRRLGVDAVEGTEALGRLRPQRDNLGRTTHQGAGPPAVQPPSHPGAGITDTSIDERHAGSCQRERAGRERRRAERDHDVALAAAVSKRPQGRWAERLRTEHREVEHRRPSGWGQADRLRIHAELLELASKSGPFDLGTPARVRCQHHEHLQLLYRQAVVGHQNSSMSPMVRHQLGNGGFDFEFTPRQVSIGPPPG